MREGYLGFRVALAPIYEGYPYGAGEYRPEPLPPIRVQGRQERIANAVEAFSARSRQSPSPVAQPSEDETLLENIRQTEALRRKALEEKAEEAKFLPPPGIRFCRHCGASVPEFLNGPNECVSCGKNLLPE